MFSATFVIILYNHYAVMMDIEERIIECINMLFLISSERPKQSQFDNEACNEGQSIHHCSLLYHLIVSKDGLYVRLIVATWRNVWTYAHGMYNATIKYEIIVLAYILQKIGDLEWNEYNDITERYCRYYKLLVY